MDFQHIINAGAGAVLAAIGWFCRQLWDAVNRLKEDLSDLREEIAKDYATRHDLKDALREVKDLLEKINDKLDHKVDKS